MRSLFILLLALVHVVALPVPAVAQSYYAARTVAVERWVEEWDEATQSWVRVSEPETVLQPAAERYAMPRLAGPESLVASEIAPAVASDAIQYGPFRLLGEGRAALMGTTDGESPAYFEAMLRDHPGIEVLEFVEAPGTRNDIANLALGRMIRAAGIATHVPENGSVRSGAVELFLAGAERRVDDGAEFAVHSWIDTYGREPDDFAADSPENRLYLDYYEEMGMAAEQAQEFYAMTNSVPHQRALWLNAREMRGWIAPPAANEGAPDDAGIMLARLDLAPALP